MPAPALPAADSLQSRVDALAPNDDWGVAAVQLLLESAHAFAASDLHLQCHRSRVLARVRCDGELVPIAELPVARRELLMARFKVLARLPAFVRNEPQDGRIDWIPPGGGGSLALRVAFLPALHGESLVVRFPQTTGTLLDLDALGIAPEVLAPLRRLIDAGEGTILLTGTSGSGKSTTLYAMVRDIHARRGDRVNVVTIEDPVEHDLGFAAQMQVHEPTGLTFERALSAALRHDPNVLLIGEIRDAATARIAVQAGMTGHLVLSSMHAGRAERVFSRLLSLGVEPFLVAAALSGSLAQRLVRTVCTECTGAGCDGCGWTGSRGRTGLFEFVEVNEPLRALILSRADAGELAAEARAAMRGGYRSQLDALVAGGRTSPREAAVILSSEEVSP